MSIRLSWRTSRLAWLDAACPPATCSKRRLIYYPVAGILAAAMLFGVYGFVNGEKTAITTVPAQIATVPIYVPQTPTPLPPTPTPLPSADRRSHGGGNGTTAAGPVTWIDVGPLLAARCGTCHNATL